MKFNFNFHILIFSLLIIFTFSTLYANEDNISSNLISYDFNNILNLSFYIENSLNFSLRDLNIINNFNCNVLLNFNYLRFNFNFLLENKILNLVGLSSYEKQFYLYIKDLYFSFEILRFFTKDNFNNFSLIFEAGYKENDISFVKKDNIFNFYEGFMYLIISKPFNNFKLLYQNITFDNFFIFCDYFYIFNKFEFKKEYLFFNSFILTKFDNKLDVINFGFESFINITFVKLYVFANFIKYIGESNGENKISFEPLIGVSLIYEKNYIFTNNDYFKIILFFNKLNNIYLIDDVYFIYNRFDLKNLFLSGINLKYKINFFTLYISFINFKSFEDNPLTFYINYGVAFDFDLISIILKNTTFDLLNKNINISLQLIFKINF